MKARVINLRANVLVTNWQLYYSNFGSASFICILLVKQIRNKYLKKDKIRFWLCVVLFYCFKLDECAVTKGHCSTE